MKRIETGWERLRANWPYLLALVPLAADCISHGGRPMEARDVATDLVSALLIFLLVAVIQSKSRRLDECAVTDKLTGLFNSRYLRSELDRQVFLAHRARTSLAMIFMDFDNLKSVNDRFGHAAGDELLRQFGELMAALVRQDMDLCFRYGGDEFLVLCSHASLETARGIAQRIYRLPKVMTVAGGGGVSLSMAVVELRPGETPHDFLARADRMVYEVKRRGKNRVAVEH